MTDIFVITYVLCGISLGLFLVAKAPRALKAIPRFRDFPEPVALDPGWPRLSVIVAACDEASTIEPALRSLLAQDYPDFQVVAVNDRSTDRTGAILDGLSQTEPKLQVEHIHKLPSGWIGKVNALHQATQAASGDWLLYTDADVHFKPGTLRLALAYAESQNLDHLTLLPRVLAPSLLLKGVVRAFGIAFLLTTRAEEFSNPESSAYIGVGAFNLVRRSALAKTEGFAWLRMEIADDMGLAKLLKLGGARSGVALADEHVEVLWYPTVMAMFRGLEKNSFSAGAGFKWSNVILLCLATWSMMLAPLIALAYPLPLLHWAGIATLAGLLWGSWKNTDTYAHVESRTTGFLANLLVPVGFLLISFMLLRSAWRITRDGGVSWRGTFYPLAELKQGRRVGF